jgi:hypothetical protein
MPQSKLSRKAATACCSLMATGTGKTYTAFQFIWRLWKAGRKKRVLFLADRNVLVDQTMVNDFRPFGPAMAKLSTASKVIEREDGTSVELPLSIDRRRRIDTSYEIYLASAIRDADHPNEPQGLEQLDSFIDPEDRFPRDRHDVAFAVHRHRCPDLPHHRDRPRNRFHDGVQADRRPGHTHPRGHEKVLLHPDRFPLTRRQRRWTESEM